MARLLEIVSLTTNSPGIVLYINCAPITLNDGEEYNLLIPRGFWNNSITGAENVVVQVKGTVSAHFLCDNRARWIHAQEVQPERLIKMVWTQHSIATVMSGAGVTPVGAFSILGRNT